MTYYATTLQTMPGRDIRPNATIDRIAWLQRYLAEMAHFSYTATYKAHAAELAKLQQERSS